MVKPSTSRLAALERRVERLTSVLILQSILLGVVVLMSAVWTAPFLTLGLLVAVPVLVFYRKSLPEWGRAATNFFRQFRSAKPTAAEPKKSLSR